MTPDRRIAAVVCVALATAAPLAGCLGSAQATAMDQRDNAHERAEEWDADAQLSFVLGIEGDFEEAMANWTWGYSGWDGSGWDGSGWDGSRATAVDLSGDDPFADRERRAEAQGSSSGSGSFWSRAEDDDSRGDGQAVVWLYVFVSPNKPDTKLKVAVDEEGEVIHVEEEERTDDDQPLSEWSIDSDEAAEIARENNEGIRTASEADHHAFVYILGEEDDHPNPVWGVGAVGGDESGGGGGWVEIDAETGQVLTSEGGSSSR